MSSSVEPHASQYMNKLQGKDDDILKLDRLQLINASARFELLSANQQLLDFHLNRIVHKKFKNGGQTKKQGFQNTAGSVITEGMGAGNNNILVEEDEEEHT